MCEASCAWLKTTQSVNFSHFKPSGRKLITRLCPALLLPAHQFLNCYISAFMQTVCHCLTTQQVCLRTKLYTVQQWIVLGGLNSEAWGVMTWWCSWCCYDWVNASSLCVMLLEFEIMLDCNTHSSWNRYFSWPLHNGLFPDPGENDVTSPNSKTVEMMQSFLAVELFSLRVSFGFSWLGFGD